MELQASRVLNATVTDLYRILVEPAEQLRWNSLYLEAAAAPPGEIRSGSTLRGRFKGSGRASVTFLNVVKDRQFTHHTLMKFPYTAITLGRFDHTYTVEESAGGTLVTQHLVFDPSRFGRLMALLIMRSFRRRLPISFDELQAYAEHQGLGDHPHHRQDEQ